MFNKNNYNNEKQNSSSDSSSIKFKMKKESYRIKIRRRLTLILGILIFIFIISTNIIILKKYDELISKIDKSKIDVNRRVFEYDKVANKVADSIVSISDETGKLVKNSYSSSNVTGIILNEEGYILTNYTSINEFKEIYVKLPSSGSMPIKANLVGANEQIDIAIIKIYYKGNLSPIKIAKFDEVKDGQEIAIFSNSMGNEYIERITPGIVTSTHQVIGSQTDNKEYRLLELSCVVNEKNTGGAVCNANGELIGLASSSITKKKNELGLYYAIDLRELEKIAKVTDVFKQKLGVSGGVIEYPKSKVKGFYVENVKESGNAYKAGIRATDIIVQLDGKSILTTQDLANIINDKKNGDNINCKVINNGEVKEIKISIQ